MSKKDNITGSKRRVNPPTWLEGYSTHEDADFDVAAATASGTWTGRPHPALVSIACVAYLYPLLVLPLAPDADAKVASNKLLSSSATRALERAASAAPTAATEYNKGKRAEKLRENLAKARAALAATRTARLGSSSSAASNNLSRDE
jgi:hypothetical protein